VGSLPYFCVFEIIMKIISEYFLEPCLWTNTFWIAVMLKSPSFFFNNFFKDFIYLFDREHKQGNGRGRGRSKFLLSMDPDLGLGPGTLRS